MSGSTNLVFDESGPPQAETLVFLHGGGAGAWMWGPVIERLPEFHCLAPDLPQHGRSQEGPFSMAGAAEAVAGLIRRQSASGRAHVVGLSLGAQVLVELLSRAPERVQTALISSALLCPLPGSGLGLYRPWSLALAYWTMMAPFKNWEAWIRLNARYSAGVPEAYFEHFRRDFQAMSRDAWVNVMSANLGYRLPAGLERCHSPALVMVGKKEHRALRRSAEALLAALPAGQGRRLKHTDDWSLQEEHNWALKAPTLFARTVQAWSSGAPLPEELEPLA